MELDQLYFANGDATERGVDPRAIGIMVIHEGIAPRDPRQRQQQRFDRPSPLDSMRAQEVCAGAGAESWHATQLPARGPIR